MGTGYHMSKLKYYVNNIICKRNKPLAFIGIVEDYMSL